MAKKRTESKLERLIRQNRAEQDRFKPGKDMFTVNRFGPLVFLLVFGVLGALWMFNSFANPDPQAPQAKARIWLTSDQTTASPGKNLTVQVWLDTAGQPANTVAAYVEYPYDKVEYVHSDIPDNRKVATRLVNTGKRVVVTRVGTDTHTDAQRIATLTFRPKATGSITFRIVPGESEVRRASDNADILGSSDGLQLTVTQ